MAVFRGYTEQNLSQVHVPRVCLEVLELTYIFPPLLNKPPTL